MLRRSAPPLLARVVAVAAMVAAAASAVGCQGAAHCTAEVDCIGPPPGCHYESMPGDDDCSHPSCGTLVCAGVDGGGSSITLQDGTALLGNAVEVNILGGASPVVHVDLGGAAGSTSWSVIAMFDTAAFQAKNLVASVDAAFSGAGLASVTRWDADQSTQAASGSVQFVAAPVGAAWSGTVTADSPALSATFQAQAVVTCFVPASELGMPSNGMSSDGQEQLLPDVDHKTAFCAQFQ